MSLHDEFMRYRRLLIGHGALLMFYGGLVGFGFLFFIMGEISLWPIPGSIHYQLPGTYKAWHMTHLEALINGAILWITAAAMPLLPLSATGIRRVTYGLIVTAWTFAIASIFDALFPNSRGLAVSDSLTNNIAFGLFYVGVVIVMVIMPYIAYRALRSRDPAS